MRYWKVPDETIRRLPIYLRGLLFSSAQGQRTVSSRQLAAFIGINPSQIRKDFSYFGGFGKRGVGYDIEQLRRQIKIILKLDAVNTAALVGIGNLGSAVLAYPGFEMYGFKIAAAFDSDPAKIGKDVKGITIEDAGDLGNLRERDISLGIIAVPRAAAQATAEALVEAGIRGILNFAPCYVSVPDCVKVIAIDFAMDFARLPYYMPSGP